MKQEMTLNCPIAIILCAMLSTALSQLNSYYVTIDVTTAPPLFLEEAVTVPVRTKCSLLCQQKESCGYFEVCSDTAGFLCKLYREGEDGSPIPLHAGCQLFMQKSETPCVDPTTRGTGTGDDVTETPDSPEVTAEPITDSPGSSSEIPGVDPTTRGTETGDDVTEKLDSPEVTAEPITDSPGSSSEISGVDMTTVCSDWSHTEPCSSYFTSCPDTSDKSPGVVVLTIQPIALDSPLKVPCCQGRLLIHRRSPFCPHGFFNKTWSDYENGFGDLTSDCFWLGLGKIRKITFLDIHSLIVTVWDDHFQSEMVSTYYSFMKTERKENFYKLNIARITVSGPDGFTKTKELDGCEFFTFDRDTNNACAQATGSGWWFDDECDIGNLNNLNGPLWRDSDGTWRTFDSSQMSLED